MTNDVSEWYVEVEEEGNICIFSVRHKEMSTSTYAHLL